MSNSTIILLDMGGGAAGRPAGDGRVEVLRS
jgi:hypothetical protein